MTRRRHKVGFGLVAGAVICAALPSAAAFLAVNRLNVVPINQTTFEVLETRGAGAADMWCAAADYARRAGLDAPRKRMYILEPRGDARTVAGYKGVVFTTSPDEELRNTPTSYSVSVKRRGENLAISHAYDFCRQFFDDFRDRF